MVAKLSSAKTISAALFATSVPFLPIATPTSAAFKAGASLTPSPVMITTSSFSCQASTIRILSSGVTRAYTEYSLMELQSSSSLISESCCPVITFSPSLKIPISLAMALAVATWSPVIIMVRIPAFFAAAMAALLSGLGGSIIPISPRSSRSFSTCSRSSSAGSCSICLLASAITRKASLAKASWTFLTSSFSLALSLTGIQSKAPFDNTR